VVSSTGARFGVNLISAVSAQSQLRFMLTKGRVTAAVFRDFLKRLLVNARTPIFVVVDGHPTHRAKSVPGLWRRRRGSWRCSFPRDRRQSAMLRSGMREHSAACGSQ
jgi:hypothetical protein